MPPNSLILDGSAPWNPLLSGALLGFITVFLLWFKGKALGVSTGFESLCSLGSGLPYFKRAELKDSFSWRIPFTAGLVLGGCLSAILAGAWGFSWALGVFDASVGLASAGKLAWMFGGGLLIGFGTRLAGGCTSGHGIYGLGNLEKGSLASTLSYFGAGIATTFIVYKILFSNPVVSL